MDFKIGQKIVNHIAFIGKTAAGEISLDPQPVLHHIYTHEGHDDEEFIFLKELNVISSNGSNERCSYASRKFRPLYEVLNEINIEAKVQECLTREFQEL